MLLNCGVGEDSWESLGLQGDPPVHPKGDQSWVFTGRTDIEAETPTLWPPDAKSWLIGKDPDAEKDWGQEEKGTTEDEIGGWHHRLDGYEFGWIPGVVDGQGGLACMAFIGLQRVRHNWATERIELKLYGIFIKWLNTQISYNDTFSLGSLLSNHLRLSTQSIFLWIDSHCLWCKGNDNNTEALSY